MDLAISIMMFVGRYNNFAKVEAVNYGWRVVRDLCNNFFIVMLLFSAVGTVLQRDNYKYDKIMPRLLAMAVMINFSRLMTLLLIDFSQVITMTFGAQIMGMTGKAILLTAINLPGNLNFSDNIIKPGDGMNLIGILAAIIFGLIVAIVAVVVIVCITVVLAYRIVMLFFLIILSPIAFAGSVFEKTKGMASQWWTELGNYLMVGPIMMFFLYISFYIIANINAIQAPVAGAGDPNASTALAADQAAAQTSGFSKMSDPASVFNMMIAIGMLIGTLVLSQKFSVAGGAILGKGVAKLKGMGTATLDKAKFGAKAAAQNVGLSAAQMAAKGTALVQNGAEKLTGKQVLGSGKSANAVADLAKNWRGNLNKANAKTVADNWKSRFKKVGLDMDDKGTRDSVKAVAESPLGQAAGKAVETAKTAAIAGAGGMALGMGATTPIGIAGLAMLAASTFRVGKGRAVAYSKKKGEAKKAETEKFKETKKKDDAYIKASETVRDKELAPAQGKRDQKIREADTEKAGLSGASEAARDALINTHMRNGALSEDEREDKVREANERYDQEIAEISSDHAKKVRKANSDYEAQSFLPTSAHEQRLKDAVRKGELSKAGLTEHETKQGIETAQKVEIEAVDAELVTKKEDIDRDFAPDDPQKIIATKQAEDEASKRKSEIDAEYGRQSGAGLTDDQKERLQRNPEIGTERTTKVKKVDDDLKAKREEALKEADPVKQAAAIKKAEDDAVKEKAKINADYEKKLGKSPTEEVMDKLAKYNVNGPILDIIKKLEEGEKRNAQRIEQIGKGGIKIEDLGTTMYSPTGMTDVQRRFFEQLTNGSKESVKALQTLEKEIRRIAEKPAEQRTAKEDISLLNMKKALAGAFKAANDGKNNINTNELAGIRTQLDRVTTASTSSKGKQEVKDEVIKPVDFFAGQVIIE
jgi:hypothetical protein